MPVKESNEEIEARLNPKLEAILAALGPIDDDEALRDAEAMISYTAYRLLREHDNPWQALASFIGIVTQALFQELGADE